MLDYVTYILLDTVSMRNKIIRKEIWANET